MPVKIECEDRIVTAYLEGEIDHHRAAAIREKIDIAIDRLVPKVLYLDFSRVTFMDSSGIGLVIGRHRVMQLYKGKLIVINASDRICKIMKLAGLDRLSVLEKGGK